MDNKDAVIKHLAEQLASNYSSEYGTSSSTLAQGELPSYWIDKAIREVEYNREVSIREMHNEVLRSLDDIRSDVTERGARKVARIFGEAFYYQDIIDSFFE